MYTKIKPTSFLFFILFSITAFSQTNTFNIEGSVIDKNDKSNLEAATVYIQSAKDSTIISYTTTDEKGGFVLQGKTKEKEIDLLVSFIGYKVYTKRIKASKSLIRLDSIPIEPVDNMLNEVVIQSNAPITIKKDTVEFNAHSFKAKKDATAEDFIKKLPGVEVDDAGQITVNGVAVNKILVNGKPFFGDDPKVALENLTKDIISKIQITDTKTKAQAFTGETGDKTNKTINITIKKDENRGVFGRATAAAGTQNQLYGSTSINFFDNDKNINILAKGNQLKQQVQSNGLKNNRSGKSAGTNFSTRYGEDNQLNSSYYFNSNSSESGNITERENIIPGHHYFSNITSGSKNDNSRHRIYFNTDIKVGETILLSVRPSFNFSDSNNTSNRDEESLDDAGALINSSNSVNTSHSKSANFSTSLNLTKRIGTNGSFFKFRVRGTSNNTDSDKYVRSETKVFGNNPSTDERNQLANSSNQNNSINTNLAYRLPLKANALFLNVSYNLYYSQYKNLKSTFDFDTNSQDYDQFNTALSNDSKSENNSNETRISFTYKKDKWYGNIGASYVINTQENNDALRTQLNLKKDFKAVDFDSRIRYSPSEKTHYSLRYSLRNSNPSLQQLNPFQDISNPLNIVTGNPNLKPTKNHNFRLNFNTYNIQRKTNFYGNINLTIQKNKVVSKTTITDDFVRHTSYTNVDGNYRINFYTGISKTIQLGIAKKLRVKLGGWGSYNNAVNFSNNIQYTSKNTNLSPNFRLVFDWGDWLEIEPSYRISFNKTDFNISQFQDKNYTNQRVQLKTRTNVPKNLEWSNTFRYQHNSEVANGLKKNVLTWDASISYSILKERGLFFLRARDILNQNNNIRRVATDDYIQYSQSAPDGQHILFGFRWKFNTRKSRA